MDDREVVILQFNGQAHLLAAMESTPALAACEYRGVQRMEDTTTGKNKTLKVRHCPVESSAKEIIMINNLRGGWHGSMLAPKGRNKNTLAILNAPTEEAAKEVLQKGHLDQMEKCYG